VSTETRVLLLLGVALLATVGSVYYYVRAVLDQDRLLSRWSAVAFVVFGVLAVVFLVSLL
jgi:hypothetical protein